MAQRPSWSDCRTGASMGAEHWPTALRRIVSIRNASNNGERQCGLKDSSADPREPIRLSARDRHASSCERKLEPQQAIHLLCKTLQHAWLVPLGADQTMNALEYKAQTLAQLIRELWDTLERPCSENIVSVALVFARRRLVAFDPQRCVVVHGDPPSSQRASGTCSTCWS